MRIARRIRVPLLVACATAALAAPAFATGQQPATEGPRTMEQSVEAVATVTAVDRAKREITLKDEDGEVRTLAVGQELKRFDEIAVGDKVHARYSVGITSELRPPTEEEKRDPFVAIAGAGASPEGTTPSGGVARMFRIVATIEALDRTTQSATLKGPEGNYVTVQVQDPELLLKPRIGDTVIVTAAESVVLSLEKVALKKKK